MAALSWEVLWQGQVSLALGISALGTALTLAATMAGMTVGALAMGRRLQRRPSSNPLWLYGRRELVIGVSGLLMLPGFRLLEHLDTWLYPLSPPLAPAMHMLGVLVLLGPPTLAMGATVPVFRLVADRHGASVSRLYGLNTAGAAIGVLVLTFALLPPLGIARTTGCVVALNLLVGAFVCRLARRARSATSEPSTTSLPATKTTSATTEAAPATVKTDPTSENSGHSPPLQAPSLATAGLLVFVTGLVTFGLEVAWFRAMRAAFWSTSGSFAVILASVLLPLAIGARLVPAMRRRGIAPGTVTGWAGAAVLLATLLVERLDLLAVFHGESYETLARWLGVSLLIIGPAITLLGMALPWCLEHFSRPGEIGRLYGLNAVGAVTGSLACAWWLLPWLGFARASWLLGGLTVLVGVLTSRGQSRRIVLAVGLPSLLIAVLQTSSPGRDRIHGHKGFRRMDGRAWLRRIEQLYDVITLEPMPPTFAGVNALYSREFYELAASRLAASRLAPGGIVAQWLPFHLVDAELSPSIAATFLDVFPNSGLWVDPPSGTGILLGRAGADNQPLGSAWPGLDRPSPRRILTDEQIREALLLDPEQLARYAAGARIITDDNQLLSFGRLHAGSPRNLTQLMEEQNLHAIVEIVGHAVPDIETVLQLRKGERPPSR